MGEQALLLLSAKGVCHGLRSFLMEFALGVHFEAELTVFLRLSFHMALRPRPPGMVTQFLKVAQSIYRFRSNHVISVIYL